MIEDDEFHHTLNLLMATAPFYKPGVMLLGLEDVPNGQSKLHMLGLVRRVNLLIRQLTTRRSNLLLVDIAHCINSSYEVEASTHFKREVHRGILETIADRIECYLTLVQHAAD